MSKLTPSSAAISALLQSFLVALSGCSGEDTAASCDGEPVVNTTADGLGFVRTPGACFGDVVFPGIEYTPRYVEVDGLQVHYVEAGPADGEVVLMLHGEPTWAYLYRYMIDGFAKAGYRAIAMDFIGMGRSDKPIHIRDYSYIGQTEQLARFIEILELDAITLVAQARPRGAAFLRRLARSAGALSRR